MNQEQILEHFKDSGALLEGHFLLSSGLHSRSYLQCALALQYPADAAMFGRLIADRFAENAGIAAATNAPPETNAPEAAALSELGLETVASPAIGGLIIGYAVAEALNLRFIWTERQNGRMVVRRGFTLKPGERILVVEDVITTGGSTRECIAALEENGGKAVAAASIVDRSNGKADVGVPRVSLVNLDVPTYTEEQCPMCFGGDKPYKPGSRTAAK